MIFYQNDMQLHLLLCKQMISLPFSSPPPFVYMCSLNKPLSNSNSIPVKPQWFFTHINCSDTPKSKMCPWLCPHHTAWDTDCVWTQQLSSTDFSKQSLSRNTLSKAKKHTQHVTCILNILEMHTISISLISQGTRELQKCWINNSFF